MKKATAIKHFKTAVRVAKVLGITESAVSHWPDIVPELSARRLQDLTAGRLKFKATDYRRVA